MHDTDSNLNPPDKSPSPPPSTGRTALTFDDLMKQKPTPWLIEGVIRQGQVGVIYAAPKLGKSFIALDMSCAVATGTDWLGHDTTQGDTVYIHTEGDAARRTSAWFRFNGKKPDRQLVWPAPINILNAIEVRKFVDEVKALGWKPKLITVDTLTKCFGGGSQNDDQDMGKFLLGIAALKRNFPEAAITVVHHTGKDAKQGPRGSSALPAAVDWQMKVKGKRLGKPKIANGSGRRYIVAGEIISELTRDEEPFDVKHYGLAIVDSGLKDHDGSTLTSCVVDELDPALASFLNGSKGSGDGDESASGAVQPSNENDSKVLLVLKAAGGDGLKHKELMDKTKLGKSSLKLALGRLQKAGLVGKCDDSYLDLRH